MDELGGNFQSPNGFPSRVILHIGGGGWFRSSLIPLLNSLIPILHSVHTIISFRPTEFILGVWVNNGDIEDLICFKRVEKLIYESSVPRLRDRENQVFYTNLRRV
jgi:hypothetical protein